MALKKKETMTLVEWIDQTGVEKVAKHFELTTEAVKCWRRGRNIPKPRDLAAIIKLSGGAVTYAGVYETFLKQFE